MIQQLHAAGIRVIMDVVYNHTFVGDNSHLNLQAPGYFYRMNEDGSWGNGSGCGNETASERAMMRRFMVESIKYWVEEYHMDGFRFDLMGIHDIETMNQIRAAVDAIDPTISIHGEGWAAGGCGIPEEERAVKNNADQFAPIGAFSDDIRDGLRGKWTDGNMGGFVSGRGLEESIKFGVVGATAHPQIDLTKVAHTNKAYATTPAQVINYMSCHDDPCVVDKLKAIHPDATIEQIIRMDLLGQTIVFTAQGVPFIYAGEELLRDKKGVHNTYQSPDLINQIDWTNKVKYAEVYNYYRNLIALRKAHPAFRMSDAAQVAEAIQFVETPANVVAYTLNGSLNNDSWNQIFVIYNGNTTDVEINLPEGKWTAVCYDAKINPDGVGDFTEKINVPHTSAVILYSK
jgi:pullulanase